MARIMIVDDAEFIRMVIKDTLLKHGHEVVAEVGDGEKAIQTVPLQKISARDYTKIKMKSKIVICYLIPSNGSTLSVNLSY